ncbi:TPR repeat-containing thioredoxin TTL4-like isoform X2 [Andrographis paniculata]|nr:TPR repeat-containing thioredoxin TTL4-like isoform X2 [Andrographis paniculata]
MGSEVDSKTDMDSPEKRSAGCGLFTTVFGCRHPRRRSMSRESLPTSNSGNTITTSIPGSKPRKDSRQISSGQKNEKQVDMIVPRPQNPDKNRRIQVRSQQGHAVAREIVPGELELEAMIQDQLIGSEGQTGPLIRASSSNVMLFGNLGNLRHNTNSNNAAESPSKISREEHSPKNVKYSTSVMGNVVKKPYNDPGKPVSFCRALSTRMDPEQLKILGNEDYKNGRFAEAVALYDAAIALDPNKASYRSNKSAALAALGDLLEAAFECREAIRINPFYQRAHNRLATIYVRLGESDKAMHHFNQAGSEADLDAMKRAKKIRFHLSNCDEAKKCRDWNTLVEETGVLTEAGADSAPLIYAMRAEALLKISRHEEAIQAIKKCSHFDMDKLTRLFGPNGSAAVLACRAQLDMVYGRFDDAVAAAEQAMRLNPSSSEASKVLTRTRATAKARHNGNELYKAEKYLEARIAYGEGLKNDPCNAVLFCNRAACNSKLGHYEKSLEDCNAALNVRPSYGKARLRRADCYAK